MSPLMSHQGIEIIPLFKAQNRYKRQNQPGYWHPLEKSTCKQQTGYLREVLYFQKYLGKRGMFKVLDYITPLALKYYHFCWVNEGVN